MFLARDLGETHPSFNVETLVLRFMSYASEQAAQLGKLSKALSIPPDDSQETKIHWKQPG